MRKRMLAALLSLSTLAALCVGTAWASGTTAAPTNDSLICDGVPQTPTVYKINGSNYFKIRDLAAILNGTEKQFSVGYDAEKKSVTADTGAGYTRLDTDLTGAPAGGNQSASPSNDTIYINGVPCQAEVYKIDGMNYFKLRDLGQALDFYVGWDGSTNTVALDTTKGYEAEDSGNDQAAMAQAMLYALNRDLGTDGSARLVDVDGDGVKELIVLGEYTANLYTWSGGQLTSKAIGSLTGRDCYWSLCQDKSTGEQGIQYSNSGDYYTDTVYYYSTREIELRCTHGDNYRDISSYTYYIDGQEVTKAEYNAVIGQHKHLEYLVLDYYSAGNAAETRAELECLLEGKTVQYVSDEILMLMAKRLVQLADDLSWSIVNGGSVVYDITDINSLDYNGYSREAARVISHSSLAEAVSDAQKEWNRIVSLRNTIFEDSLQPMMPLVEYNGGLYFWWDSGIGSDGGFGVIERMVSRTDTQAVFSGYYTFDGIERMGTLQFSLVFEDGTWKYLP